MNLYKPEHFDIREFVPQETYDALNGSALLVMDYRILKTSDAIREFFNKPMTINNWHTDGPRKYSGYRPPACKEGAPFSQHRFGRAIDFLIDGMDSETVRKEILANSNHFPQITAMESGTSWVHIDCRAITGNKIEVFKP